MGEKFKGKFRIPSIRLQGYDYGSTGLYFVTICTKNRLHSFGEISDSQMGNTVETDNYPSLHPTAIGLTSIDFWLEIPQHFPFVELDAFVVMPNHIHGILSFNKPDKNDWIPNKFGSQSQNLGAVIRGFKSSVKRFANQNNIDFEWQTRYHDHIIRNEDALNAIRRYIINNPSNWLKDSLNKSNLESIAKQSSKEIEQELYYLLKDK
ncbi:MAG: transposase [Saprospiraceae bacterium]